MQNYKIPTYTIHFLLACFVSFYAPSVKAAPFCVQLQGGGAECIYNDATSCRRRADELTGLCVANPQELTITPGIGKYCLVDSNRIVQCNYADRTNCAADAARSGAVCIEALPRSVQEDPYKLQPNVNY